MTPEWLVAVVGVFQLLVGVGLGLLYAKLRVGSVRDKLADWLADAWDEGWTARDAHVWQSLNPHGGDSL